MDGQDIQTLISTALGSFEDQDGSVVAPIHLSTTFERSPDYSLASEYLYRREGSPTVGVGERAYAQIEGGADAMLFASGMSAFTSLVASLPKGASVIAPRIMYHGAQDWLVRLDRRKDLKLRLVDDMSTSGLVDAIDAPIDLVWFETPANPTWDVFDIREVANAAHRVGAIVGVDSTVAPPVTTRPLDLGADIVFHSASKYLNGHSDVNGGVLVTSEATPLWEEVAGVRTSLGTIMSPFETWLLMRGLKTLGVRYERASSNAMKVARGLENTPHVERVLYPGLESHPGHTTAVGQMTGGFGGMISILIDGDVDDTRAVASGTKVFTTATSLGGTESLIEHRASVEGPNSVVPPNLIRISVGLESSDDLLVDLTRSIEQTFA